MKKLLFILGCVALLVPVISCNKVRRSTGRAYMPDMYYSRAYETYASTEALQQAGVHYSAMPVPGTIARGELMPYPYKNDSTGYDLSVNVKNPLDSASMDLVESERLYLVNCAICHGSKLDGQGPLYNGGKGPYPSAPKNFMDSVTKQMPIGRIFHVATYGKGVMGSYASQLTSQQRWMVAAYIKSKQAGKPAADTAKTATAPKPADAAVPKPAGTK